MIDLHIKDKRGNIIIHQLGQGKHRLGKSATSDIILIDPFVSRHHLDLIITEDAIYLNDLGSTNGTFVAGQRIDDTTKLPHETFFQLGHSECIVKPSVFLYYVKEGRAYDPGELAGQNGHANLPENVFSIDQHKVRQRH